MTPWTAAYQAPPSMGFSRQEYWSEVSLPSLDRFLEKFNLPRLNQREIEIMNNPITGTEIETVIKNLPKEQKPRTRWLHRIILSNIERRANAYPSKLFQKIAEEGTLPNSFHEATTTLILKPEKDNTQKKKTTGQYN